MTSTTETANATADQSVNQTAATQDPVSPTTDNNETATEQQTEQQSNAETASPKKEPAPPKPTIHKPDFEKDVVYLFQFSRCPTIPSASPFCLKVENWLRMNGIQYEVCLLDKQFFLLLSSCDFKQFLGVFQPNIYLVIVWNVLNKFTIRQ